MSSTGTTSSSPILAPDRYHNIHQIYRIKYYIHQIIQPQITPPPVMRTRERLWVHPTSDSDTTSDSDSDSESDSSTVLTSKRTLSDGQAIVVEDYKSKAIAQRVDIDENIDIISGEIALPQKRRKSMDGDDDDKDEEDEGDEDDPNGGGRHSEIGPPRYADVDRDEKDPDDDDDDDSTHSSDGDVITELPHSHLRGRRSSSTKFGLLIDKFPWNTSDTRTRPKVREWQSFQFYLGFKRFILVILYGIVALEEAFVLTYVKWWLPLPLVLSLTYLLLISCDFNKKCGAFNRIKHDHRIRTLMLIAFYFMNVMIIIAPPMNTLIASANVYDYGDLYGRNLIYNHLMWTFFVVSIVSMIFIDIIIVHDDDETNDKYRVETFKLAIVKDEEYILNNQCLWYSVPRKDWGKIDKKFKQKAKRAKCNQDSYSLDGVHSSDNTKQSSNNNTKSFFVRIGLGKDDDSNSKNHIGNGRTISDEEDDDDDDDQDSTSYDDDEEDEDEIVNNNRRINKIGNKNMKNRSHINTDNEFDDDRQSIHSITNIINNNHDGKIWRCCTAPFSVLQWILTFTFFISLQLCVVFAIFETLEIEKHDSSVPPPPQ